MLPVLISAALLSQTVNYQEVVFTPPSVDEGELDPAVVLADEVACMAAFLPTFHPSHTAGEFLGVVYARDDQDRSRSCVTWTIQRSEPIEDFAARGREDTPQGGWFSSDGTTAYWIERLAPVCVPNGQLAGLRACLSSPRWGITAPGKLAWFGASRSRIADDLRMTSVREAKTGSAIQYGIARAQGRALSHTSELPPAQEEAGP